MNRLGKTMTRNMIHLKHIWDETSVHVYDPVWSCILDSLYEPVIIEVTESSHDIIRSGLRDAK